MGSLAIQPNSRRAYGLAVLLLLLALAAQWSLRPVLGSGGPFLFFLPAIGIAAMWGGWRPALLVLAASCVHAAFWLRPDLPAAPRHPLATQVVIAGYLVGAGLLLALGGRLNQLRARAVAAERHLNEQVNDLRALHDLSARIASRTALDAQIQALLEALCGLLGARQGLLLLADDAAKPPWLVASVGFTPQSVQAEVAALREPAAAGGDSVHLRPLVHGGGRTFGCLALYYPAPRRAGEREQRLFDLCAGMVTVLVQREEALRQANASSRRLEVALESSAVPFCLLQPLRDDGGRVRGFRWEYVNAAAARLFLRPAEALVGRPVREALGEDVQVDPELLERLAGALRERRTRRFESWAGPAGRRRWFEFIVSPHGAGLAVWFSEVTARRAQEEALRAADRQKDEFLATLAHELRNPLAPIRQAALIGRSPAATEAQKQWSHGVIERQVAHMAMLLDDLLDVSRITRGKLELRCTPMPLAEAVDAALETARPLVEARQQELRIELPQEPLWLDADRLRVAQVLSNLLTNASKYTPAGGRLGLATRAEGEWAVIEVSDDGAGIAPDALEGIFQMFTQVRGADEGRGGGLGIGLALSRGLVELHGGTLAARSDGLGRGSTFTVRLPLASAPARRSAPAAPAAAEGRPRRVLVADDNRDAAQSLADLLRIEGHEVALAFDGEEALQRFAEFQPEVALLDIGMPRRTGNEVATAIRSRPDGAATLLVAITGWGQERDRHAARAAGFDHHFTKPVNPAQVIELLRRQPRREG